MYSGTMTVDLGGMP
jgi:hypothetical protein